MPLYEWHCVGCELTVEQLQSTYEPQAPTCVGCGKAMGLQLIATTVLYKGTGWAKEDRKKEGKQ
jgi:putative FmdB family regulatory protein